MSALRDTLREFWPQLLAGLLFSLSGALGLIARRAPSASWRRRAHVALLAAAVGAASLGCSRGRVDKAPDAASGDRSPSGAARDAESPAPSCYIAGPRSRPRATLVEGSTRVGGPGTVAPELVQQTFEHRFSAVRWCYQKRLQANENLRGKLVVRFTIGPNGRVDDASIRENETGDVELARCVVDDVRGWPFPTPERGSVTVDQGILFDGVEKEFH